MRKDLINDLIPVISSLTMWGWNKIFGNKRSKKSSFFAVTGIAVITGAVISYFAINRFVSGSFK